MRIALYILLCHIGATVVPVVQSAQSLGCDSDWGDSCPDQGPRPFYCDHNKQTWEARDWFCPRPHTGTHWVIEDGYADLTEHIGYAGMAMGFLQGFFYGFGPNLQKWAIDKEVRLAEAEGREPLPEGKLKLWLAGMIMYTGAGIFQMIGLSMAPFAIVAPFIGLAVPTNILSALYLNGIKPSYNAVVACCLIVPCVAICALCGPVQQACLDSCEDAPNEMINYILTGGGIYVAWHFWVALICLILTGLLLWQIKMQIKIRNPAHQALPALYGTIAGFFGGATTFTLSLLGSVVAMLFHPDTIQPLHGYRDLASDSISQQFVFPNFTWYGANAGRTCDLGGGGPCWKGLTAWGWYLLVPVAAFALILQIRWINRGTKHYGCDVVVPCEVVANVLVANFCGMFLHSEVYWFDFSIFVREDHSLYSAFQVLYGVGNALGFVALLVLANTPRSDGYNEPDHHVLRLFDHNTKYDEEDESSWWHLLTPSQYYVMKYSKKEKDTDLNDSEAETGPAPGIPVVEMGFLGLEEHRVEYDPTNQSPLAHTQHSQSSPVPTPSEEPSQAPTEHYQMKAPGRFNPRLDPFFAKQFERYDLDCSGTINSVSELTQLSTNVAYMLKLSVANELSPQNIPHVDDTCAWSVETFVSWFSNVFDLSEVEIPAGY